MGHGSADPTVPLGPLFEQGHRLPYVCLPAQSPHISTKPQGHATQGTSHRVVSGEAPPGVCDCCFYRSRCLCARTTPPPVTLSPYAPLYSCPSYTPPSRPCTVRSEPQEAGPASVQTKSQDWGSLFSKNHLNTQGVFSGPGSHPDAKSKQGVRGLPAGDTEQPVETGWDTALQTSPGPWSRGPNPSDNGQRRELAWEPSGDREVTEGGLGPLYEQGAADGPLLSLSDCQEPEGSAKGGGQHWGSDVLRRGGSQDHTR